MKDKEKQNCNNCVCKTVCFERANIEDIDGKESKAMKSWEEYVKQYGCQYYQPKLSEDSVVLSREEYNEMVDDVKVSKDKLVKIIDSAKEKGSKETAEKFANEILNFIHNETFHKGYELKKVERKIKEFAKEQFSIEIKE